MARSKSAIEQDLMLQLRVIDQQMTLLSARAQRTSSNPAEMTDASGNFLITPLILARSNVVLAEVMLREKK